jgi:hypothetical protein
MLLKSSLRKRPFSRYSQKVQHLQAANMNIGALTNAQLQDA